MGLQAPQPLEDRHVMKGFDCGDPTLNQWLQQRALANQRSGATREQLFKVIGPLYHHHDSISRLKL